MSGLPVIKGGTRILDFDIENRPASYWIPDKPTAQITSIAAAWAHRPREVFVWLLRPVHTLAEWNRMNQEMLLGFKALYDEANVVTGHYIRKHDLPIINGALMEHGLPLLGAKMVQDTKMDMVKKGDIPATQEFLAEMLEIEAQKYHMTQVKWRRANTLVDEGLEETRRRVTRDVKQHMDLRKRMLAAGVLKSPKVWRP